LTEIHHAPIYSQFLLIVFFKIISVTKQIPILLKMSDHSIDLIHYSIEELVMKTYLQITLQVADKNREAAAGVYTKYKAPFLDTVAGAESKALLVRDEDVQVLHGFSNKDAAEAYLKTDMFSNDVVSELGPLLDADPEVRIYEAN
jgi:hypothetical protein